MAQPTAPLKSAELDQCRQVARRWLHGIDHSGHRATSIDTASVPIILTYASKIAPDRWLLGLSAAAKGVPLVLAGLGRPGFGWTDPAMKLPGARRGAQLLSTIMPAAPIIFTDGGDTMLINEPQLATRSMLLRARSESTVLISSVCSSWPICYNASYWADKESSNCRATWPTCYPNSGMFMASGSAMYRYVSMLEATTARLTHPAERLNDAAGMHHLYLNRTAEPELTQEIDASSTFFLNIFPCTGPRYRLRAFGPHEYCHDVQYEPLNQVHLINGTDGVRGLTFRNALGDVQQPLLLHANGLHSRLTGTSVGRPSMLFKPLIDRYLPPLGRPPRAALLARPVLLVDSALHGEPVCALTTMGDIFSRAREQLEADHQAHERERVRKVGMVARICDQPWALINRTVEKVLDWVLRFNATKRLDSFCKLAQNPVSLHP